MNDNSDSGANSSLDNAEREVFNISIYNAKLYEETGYKEFASTWLSFPTTAEAVQAALNEIGVDGKNYSRYLIDERESNIKGLADCFPENAHIDELNYLAVKIQGLDENQHDILGALIDKNSRNFEVAELINAVDNIDCYILQPAFTAEEYGEFLRDTILDVFGNIANDYLKDSKIFGNFMTSLDEIEKYIDTEKFGNDTAEKEGGYFTDFGYLLQDAETTKHYKGISDVPPEYRVYVYPEPERKAGLFKIENTDISDFVYKLHVLAGDYTNDLQYNMRMLPESIGEDYTIIMNSHNIRITESEHTYQDHTDINSVFRKFPHDTRAYLFHIDNRENGRAYGSIVMVDCGTLSEDIDKNSISFTGITIDIKNSMSQYLTREEWNNVKHIDHDKIAGYQYHFDDADVQNLTAHREDFFKQRLQEAEMIAPDTLLDYLNAEYMSEANYSQPGMIRVPQETARIMLLYEDASVYRLTPRSAEQLSTITAAKNGLNFNNFREFAVKKDNKSGIDKMCGREIDRITSRQSERNVPSKPDKFQSL